MTRTPLSRSKVNLQGAGAYCGGLLHSLLLIVTCLYFAYAIVVYTADIALPLTPFCLFFYVMLIKSAVWLAVLSELVK